MVVKQDTVAHFLSCRNIAWRMLAKMSINSKGKRRHDAWDSFLRMQQSGVRDVVSD